MRLYITILLLISSIYLSSPPEAYTKNNPVGLLLQVYEGKASYYHTRFNGRKTANGERFNQENYTAAHRFLPFGTIVRITNLVNGYQHLARINDRGPVKSDWIVDVSQAIAKQLKMLRRGITPVQVEVVGTPSGHAAQSGTAFFLCLDKFSSPDTATKELPAIKQQLSKKNRSSLKVQQASNSYLLTVGSFKTYASALSTYHKLKTKFPQAKVVCLPV